MPRFQIIYEDDSLIVVNKVANLLVIPTPRNETNTLTDLLNEQLAKNKVNM